MKYLLSILLILTLSFQGFSQKKGKKKPTSKTKEVKSDVTGQEVYDYVEKIIPDTLFLQKGKKYVLLIDVNTSQTVYDSGDDNNSEEAELKRNFPEEDLQIITINKYTYVRFEKQQAINITGENRTYKAFAYWSGKIDDKAKVKGGIRMATEFVAEQLNSKKESSYVINARKYKKEVALLVSKNKITSKYKELMKAVIATLTFTVTKTQMDNPTLFKQGSVKLKTLDTYILKKKGVRIHLKNINFNSEGLPTSLSSYNEGKLTNKRTFIYNDGILINVIQGEDKMINVTYNDNKMILSDNLGEGNATYIYWLENGKILERKYILMIDDKFSYMNGYTEEKIENNCIVKYVDNILTSKDCSSQSTVFLSEHTSTSFQNGEVIHCIKSKLEKKGERTFEKYYSVAKSKNQNDNYKLWGTFYLDDDNLIDTYNFTDDNIEQTIKIDYTYYE